MKVALDISVASSLWRGLPSARSLARETIAASAAESGMAAREGAEVSLRLGDDSLLRALNLRWRGIDAPTNVLSFPSAAGALVDAVHSPSLAGRPFGRPLDRVSRAQRARLQPAVAAKSAPIATLGDIALAYETLAREAEELGVPLGDHYRHLVAHGFLHLIGYDHQTDKEAERMEALETRILARLGAADPYAPEVVDE
jgi:probable rRNA maturation factor